MTRIAVIVVFMIACLIWGNWRNWKEYYPTILYFIVGDFAYNFVFNDHYLWKYEGFVNHTVSDILVAVVSFPCVIILFFTYYPDRFKKKALYILAWTLIMTAVEAIVVYTKYFSYHNGWNLLWSIGVFFFMFILLALHKKHPLITWPVSLAFGFLLMLLFKVPIQSLD